jgi:hypothetical protein
MKSWQGKEIQARRVIEDQGFVALDANVLFRANCPNIDLVVFGKDAATPIQVIGSFIGAEIAPRDLVAIRRYRAVAAALLP